MRGYRIKQENENWCFELIPSNNNNQPIGRSSLCSTKEECMERLKFFRRLIIENRISDENSPFISISKQLDRFTFCYICNGDKIYESNAYWQKESCKKGISAIYKYLDEYTLRPNIS